MSKPILWIVIPCYNEEQVLPITAPMFLEKISGLAAQGQVSEKSRVLLVNAGSKDKTWELIQSFAAQDEHYIGISQSRNRGHQNAVLAGLMAAVAVVGAKLSNNQHKVDQAWDWLRRIWIAWAVINGIGAFIAYVAPLFSGLATLTP